MTTALNVELIYEKRSELIVKLIGSIDTTNQHLLWANGIRQTFLEIMLTSQINTVIIDLTEVERMDSRGLRQLHDIHRMLASMPIQLILKNPNLHLHRVLKIIHFHHLFDIRVCASN